MSPELKTPPDRRLARTDAPGVYRRGQRYAAVTYDRGKRIKTTHDTKTEACRARARRCLRPSAAGRERFRTTSNAGWSSTAAAPPAASHRRPTMPTPGRCTRTSSRTCGASASADIGRADIKRFIDHLAALAPRQRQNGATRLAAATIRKVITPLRAMLAEAYELEIIPTDAARVRLDT